MTVMLMGLTPSTVTAKDKNKRGKDPKNPHYRSAQPVVFVERGVEFFIFPDGSFDFNTDYGHKRSRYSHRSTLSSNYGRVWNGSGRSHGVYVSYDRFGQVRRINNMSIDYDRRGKVRHIGSVVMKYNRGNGRLKQVGSLRVNYNHWGTIVHSYGSVNPFNRDLNCGISGDFEPYAYHFQNDDDYIYYRDGDRTRRKRRLK